MSRYRRFLALPAAVLATAALTTSALAAGPDQILHIVDESHVLPAEICGFPILEEARGTVRERIFFDAGGEFAGGMNTFASFKVTWTNTETGASAWTVVSGLQRLTVNDDGSWSVAITGVQGRVERPDGGFVAQIGRMVLHLPVEGPDELVSMVGRTDGAETGPFPELCDALAG